MFSINSILPLGSALLALGIVACGGGGGESTTTTSASSGGTGAATASSTGVTSPAGSTSSTGTGTGGTSTSTGTGGTTAGTGGAAAVEYDAIFVGTLASTDLTTAQAAHDMVAKGAQAQAQALGDIAHFVLLGTTVLGTTQNQFFALDRWATANMDEVYGNAMFQAALGTVLSPVPPIGKYEHNTTWASFGDINAGKAYTPYYFALIRGTLADPATAQATHDAGVAGGKAAAMAAGDVAHNVYIGRDDPTQVAFIDIWQNTTGPTAVYTSASFQQAFGALFTAAPEIGIYESTDWYQW